jgi:alpha-beta hydrolase superfamily lysophospholipase
LIETFRASDGYEFAYRRYPAAGTAKAHLVFAHGIRSHAGWYEKSCTELANRGFEVSFLDRRGAGLNDKDRGDCLSFRRLLDDLTEFIRAKKTTIPTIVAGISWGGKLAISLPAHAPGLVDRIILITPGIVPLVSVPFATRLRIAAARLFNPKKRFPIPLNDPQLFTGSPHWQQFIEQDERGLREATARFLFNSVQLDFYLRRNLAAVNCPVLLLSAGKDRIADAAKSKAVLERGLKPGLLTEIVYADAQHTLEFEEGCMFVEDIVRNCI